MSAWAVGRGLLRGNRLAWWWARGLAGAMAPLMLLGIVLMQIFPEHSRWSTPLGTHQVERGDPLLLLGGAGLVALLTWQFFALNSPAVRDVFDRRVGGRYSVPDHPK